MKWAIKIAAKIVLSRLPLPYFFWRSIGLFRHGGMDRAAYAIKIFRLHAQRAYPLGLPTDSVVLELGPGDSVASAVIAAAHGAAKIILIDVGDYARKDIGFYRALAKYLSDCGLDAPNLTNAVSREDLLAACNAQYLTAGLQSLRQLPDGMIDFVWSHSVLEHISKCDLQNTFSEFFRVMAAGARASHNVDYQDHLASGLNNLRFSERLWESSLFTRSGFYTNRVPAIVMHGMFRDAGFDMVDEQFGAWPNLPTPRRVMSKEFQCYSDQDLIRRTSSVLLRRPDCVVG